MVITFTAWCCRPAAMFMSTLRDSVERPKRRLGSEELSNSFRASAGSTPREGKRTRASMDPDILETSEWVDSLRAVLHHRGTDRAAFLIEHLTDEAQRAGVSAPFTLNTPY